MAARLYLIGYNRACFLFFDIQNDGEGYPIVLEVYYGRSIMADVQKKIVGFTVLKEQVDDKNPDATLDVAVRLSNGMIEISFDGYGDHCSQDGHGCPVMIELYYGKPRLIVWGDINQEEPTHVIDLEGAAEYLRKEDEEYKTEEIKND